MLKRRVYRTFYFRLGLQILALEAAFLACSWLLHRYWIILERFSFADVLFVMGALAGMMGSIGMMRSPYRIAPSPWGVGKLNTGY